MTLIINISSFRVDLPHDAHIMMRPISPIEYQIALLRARRKAQEETQGLELDAAALEGLATIYFCRDLVLRYADRWEGVTSSDGAVLPITPETVERVMMIEGVAAAILSAIADHLREVRDEGNG